MSNKRRLIVCLDGTWNQKDSSTNVLHHFNLIREGDVEEDGKAATQIKEYFRGVGTGPVDRITGGGFGFGLEQNVRDAYDWLVENYRDGGEDPRTADEIFIFGFSRGAYTARSLVGLIASYGILRRGAPLPVSQLWDNYCVLGRRREKHDGIWERIFGEGGMVPRRITDLAIDPWLLHRPGHSVSLPETDSEKLLVEWSRRAKITYLGIYDTVGAIGWDALAIPGLRSKMALHNNMRPTTLIQSCYHALAIDENRSSFERTPFVAYLGPTVSDNETARGQDEALAGLSSKKRCAATQAMWKRKIHQRWFVGAHSNIGGGYPDNSLAQLPLNWLTEGAKAAGLICEDLPPPPTLVGPHFPPRDSYTEFAPPLWTLIIRNKRNYRAIDPLPEERANPDPSGGAQRPGFVLKNINEKLHDSVFTYYGIGEDKEGGEEGDKIAPPPNLIEYARRAGNELAAGKYGENLRKLGGLPAANPWPGASSGSKCFQIVALLVWAALAALGLRVTDAVFLLWSGAGPDWVTLFGVFGIMCLADLAENYCGFALAKDRTAIWRRAVVDVLYWVRTVGFVLFVFAAVALIACLVGLGLEWIGPWFGRLPSAVSPPAELTQLVREAGLLLLLQMGLVYFVKAFSWLGEPMHTANLGSIVPLQLCASPKAVKARLDLWQEALSFDAEDTIPGVSRNKLGPVREALWRDMLGYIPLYTLVLGFGSWLAAGQLHCPWLKYWWVFPIVAAVADYAEDICHLRYLAIYEKPGSQQPSGPLTLLSFCMTVVKFLAFGGEAILTLAAVFLMSAAAFVHPVGTGWRGLLGLSVTLLTILVLVVIPIWAFIYRALNKKADATGASSGEE